MNLASAAHLLLVLAIPSWAESPVAFEREETRLLIKIDGKPFATYAWNDPAIQRPYFADVRSPKGVRLTRNFPPVEGKDAIDHAAMHPGLWLAFGDITGADFWRNKGVVRHAGFIEPPRTDPQGGQFAVLNRYEADGKMLCEETCRIRIDTTPRGYRIMWQSEFRGPDSFTFGDQEEMGLGVRMATDRIVTHGGVIRDSEGRRNEEQVWGKTADWCDYSGPDGGILLMPDPRNFRRSWFHARDYGLLVANPFGRQSFTQGEPSRVSVEPGEALTLRFGILIHGADTDLQAAYTDYLAARDESSGPAR